MSRPTAPRPTAVLIGADGMLGRAMAAELNARGCEFRAPTREELDLSKPETIRGYFERSANPGAIGPPNYIINCAAWTDVDGAEIHESEAKRINADAVRELAVCAGVDTLLLTFSTDYIFNGQSARPYPTDHPRSPTNAYGRSKAAGEAELDARPSHSWLNIRTSWLYAPWGKNFVLTMMKLLREMPQVKVVNDQRGRPTSALHLAGASLLLLERGAHGHHHITDGGECTWFELTQEIKRLSGAPAEVTPCTSEEFPRPAKRPAYSVLDLSRTEALIGPMPHWKENLADVMARIHL